MIYPHHRVTVNFPDYCEGDRWCLCAARWQEAFAANVAPSVILRATHRISLQHVKLDDLRQACVW